MKTRISNRIFFRIIFVITILFISGFADAHNTIKTGLPEYGIRDCHVIIDDGKYYMTGTEIAPPGEEKRGITLYESSDMKKWKSVRLIVDRNSIPEDSWYRDAFDSPEIHKINGKYVLCFGGRNNDVNPYSTTETVIAVSNRIDGEYTFITDKPVIKGNRFTLWQDDENGSIYAYWEKDGSIYGAMMSDSLTEIKGSPTVIAVPREYRKDDRFLDSPSVLKYNGKIYLFYTVFKGGYYATYLNSDTPLGPWKAADDILFYRSEDQAPTQLHGKYSDSILFCPPCEIIGNIQIMQGLDDKWYIVYHSEDKYAEPFFCFDEAEADDNGFRCKITLP